MQSQVIEDLKAGSKFADGKLRLVLGIKVLTLRLISLTEWTLLLQINTLLFIDNYISCNFFWQLIE